MPRKYVIAALTVAWIVGFSGCKPSHQEARHFKIAETELSIPSPTLDAAFNQRLEWNMASCVDAYDDIGSHNAKWNFAAREALQIMAQQNALNGLRVESSTNLLPYYLGEAMSAGCDDPLVKYADLRYAAGEKMNTPLEFGLALCDAAVALHGSKYPRFRKFRACYSAFRQLRHIQPHPQQLAGLLDSMEEDFFAALEDRHLPPEDFYSGGMDYEWCINGWTDFEARWNRLDTILSNRWANSEITFLLRGQYYKDLAWWARGSDYADKVPAEAWKLFFDRLNLAEQNLTRASEIATNDARPATAMITVSAARQKVDEMEIWFQKAMQLDPNNYRACQDKLGFLLPRWYGSPEIMLAFGRQCVDSTNWAGEVPLILADAHWDLSRETTNAYWSPEVWPDIQASFEKFFELNPRARSWRNNYAWYAFRCSQWDVCAKQLDILGPDLDIPYFGGAESVEAMQKELAAHRGKKLSAAQ